MICRWLLIAIHVNLFSHLSPSFVACARQPHTQHTHVCESRIVLFIEKLRWHPREGGGSESNRKTKLFHLWADAPRSLESSLLLRVRCVFLMCVGDIVRVHANDTHFYYYLCVCTRVSPRHMSNGFWHHRSTSPMEYEWRWIGIGEKKEERRRRKKWLRIGGTMRTRVCHAKFKIFSLRVHSISTEQLGSTPSGSRAFSFVFISAYFSILSSVCVTFIPASSHHAQCK